MSKTMNIVIENKYNGQGFIKVKPLEWKVNPKGMIDRMIENMFNRDFNK